VFFRGQNTAFGNWPVFGLILTYVLKTNSQDRDVKLVPYRFALNPVSAFENGGSEVAPVIGRERTGILSTNHRGYFRPSVLKSGDWV